MQCTYVQTVIGALEIHRWWWWSCCYQLHGRVQQDTNSTATCLSAECDAMKRRQSTARLDFTCLVHYSLLSCNNTRLNCSCHGICVASVTRWDIKTNKPVELHQDGLDSLDSFPPAVQHLHNNKPSHWTVVHDNLRRISFISLQHTSHVSKTTCATLHSVKNTQNITSC